ncbi:unnamed protein product [Darwinula stevensoni]|uniref:EGF-like domain-containing protein n=1 Tax=Darwinula stevensoni TaxID=69355 RepID=A0A7R8X5H7_9CRUS|nr:unnamed protein product [Darwinula stevensoni]CAG0887117.1 unnamed protein product [Darwinula stevensoni]
MKVPPGGNCENYPEDCVENAVCQEMCTCNEGFQEEGDHCEANPDPGLGEPCDSIIQNCITENAECVGDAESKKCRCKDGYVLDGDVCSE